MSSMQSSGYIVTPCLRVLTVGRVAHEFIGALRCQLSPDEMAQVVALNDLELDTLVCHSHDFCDANVVMATVFAANGLDPLEDRCQALWNTAWDLAKLVRFDASRII